MATSDKDTARVTLPGRMYEKAGRWWWSVKLPGEDRCHARALRGPGDRIATTDRRTAETAALALWQEAVIRHAQAEILAAAETQSLEKSCAYAFLIGQINEAPKLSFRQAPWTAPSTFEMQVACGTESITSQHIESLSHHSPSAHSLVTSQREPDPEVGSGLDVMAFLSERSETQDRQGCDCCDSKDFFDEYLQIVETGQKLCPRCVQALRDDVRVAEPEEVMAI